MDVRFYWMKIELDYYNSKSIGEKVWITLKITSLSTTLPFAIVAFGQLMFRTELLYFYLEI